MILIEHRLTMKHPRVFPVSRDEFIVRSVLNETASVEYENAIDEPRERETVADDDRGSLLGELENEPHDIRFGLRIE